MRAGRLPRLPGRGEAAIGLRKLRSCPARTTFALLPGQRCHGGVRSRLLRPRAAPEPPRLDSATSAGGRDVRLAGSAGAEAPGGRLAFAPRAGAPRPPPHPGVAGRRDGGERTPAPPDDPAQRRVPAPGTPYPE